MKRFLKLSEREELIFRHKQERDKRICDRIKAVLLRDEGYSYAKISHILLLDDATVRRFVKDYEESKKLLPGNKGSESRLCENDTEKLLAHLSEKTYLYVKEIKEYVAATFGVNYTISGLTHWLHAHGFGYKKPQPTPAKANKEAQQAFIETYDALKAQAGTLEPIYFVDSVHPQHQTRLARGWILKKVRKFVATTAKQYRLNFIGGIRLQNHDLIYHQVDKVNAITIKEFLEKLRDSQPNAPKIHVIWDNAGYHHSKDIVAFALERGIIIHYLPAYSPNLNPIERLWKIMHQSVTYNQYYPKFADFTEKILEFFNTIDLKKDIMVKRITDNFQLINYPNLA